MALLLRRVRQAFEVAPEDVRLVATSATIGVGEATRKALREFVADLAGIRPDRVDVFEGVEDLPDLPSIRAGRPLDPEALPRDRAALRDVLAPDPAIRSVRD